jgi:xanthosine phosphorylase
MTAQAASASTGDKNSVQAQHVKNVEQSRGLVLSRLGALKPKIAIILGSGLGGLGDKVQSAVRIPYKDLPGFPIPTIPGHSGELIAGKLNGVDVIALKGRKHFYETDDPYPLKTMIRTMKAVGIDTLFVSNAAGILRKEMGVSELMAITDHINWLGTNPLIGANDEDFGPRFFPMADAWDPALRAKLKEASKTSGATLHEGVYIAFRGPMFETPAEIRMAITLGAHAVGMSSVPDCIIARHCGMKVVGCSILTNMGAGLSDEQLSHDHTLEMAARGAASFEKLVMEFVKLL